MKKKSVFKKIAFLLTIALIANMGVFDLFTIRTKAADDYEISQNYSYLTVKSGENYSIHGTMKDYTIGVLTVESGGSVTVSGNATLRITGKIINYGTITNSRSSLEVSNVENHGIFIEDIGSLARPNEVLRYVPEAEIDDRNMTQDGRYTGNSITLIPPDNYLISVSDPTDTAFNDSMWRDRATINPLETTRYWLRAEGLNSSAINVPEVTFKNEADEPANGKYYKIDDSGTYDSEGHFYWDYVVLAPPNNDYRMISFSQNGNYSSYNPSMRFVTPVRNYKAKLEDQDNLITAGEGNVENFDILSRDSFDIVGERVDIGNDNPNTFYQSAKIVAGDNSKVLLASEYSANGTNTGRDEINITSSQENLKIYVQYYGYWIGPVNVGDISISNTLGTPENPYSLSGKKYKDKFYESDVVLTPAEGYLVTTSKDKTPTDKLTFTKTTKDVKVYLARVRDVVTADGASISDRYAFSDQIKVGDIYILREGEGKVNVNDLYYGGKVIPTVETKTNDVKKVTYKYKNASGGDYLKEAPSEVGKYVVEATFEMTDDYKELVVKDEFTISYLPTPTAPYSLEGKLGDNEIYTTDVKIIPADGYQISKTIKTGYVDSIELDKNGDIGYVYLKKKATGEMTDKIAIKEIMIDKEMPVITGIADKEVIYTDSKQVIVKDDNLFEVIVNGVKVAVSNGQAVIDLSADNGIMDYTIVMKDKAGHESTIFVTLITAWMKDGSVQEGVPLKLYPGYTYNFPEGSTWTIEGDPTVYCGGNKFVVTNNVEIKFKKN